ncbi:932_t:CDS:1, partial [Cetraspora pellucida]
KHKENVQLYFKKSKISAETLEQQQSTSLSQAIMSNIEDNIIIESNHL